MEIWNHLEEAIVSNGVVTEYFYDHIPGFKLNGKRQSLTLSNQEKLEIYPKETFEAGRVFGKSYTLHFADSSWNKQSKKTAPGIKLLSARLPVNLMAYRQHQKAKRVMQQNGKYQKWYFEEMHKAK